jgi:hypothetical protein
MTKKKVQCAVCKALIPQNRTDLWVYHESFPGNGVVCRHHHGVEEEYNRLLKEAGEALKGVIPDDYIPASN